MIENLNNNLRYAGALPEDVRLLCRDGKLDRNTSGMCAGYAQANLVVLPKEQAYDFCCSPPVTPSLAHF